MKKRNQCCLIYVSLFSFKINFHESWLGTCPMASFKFLFYNSINSCKFYYSDTFFPQNRSEGKEELKAMLIKKYSRIEVFGVGRNLSLSAPRFYARLKTISIGYEHRIISLFVNAEILLSWLIKFKA